jgi:hypothetical protein
MSALLLALAFSAQVETFDVIVIEGEPPGPRVRTVEDALRPSPRELSDDPIPVRTGFRERLLQSAARL